MARSTVGSQPRGAKRNSRSARTVRLTTAQALVRYLSVQHSELDGKSQRFIPGMFGIFGHGNVAGLGQALESCGKDLTYYHSFHEQSMVHTAVGLAKATRRTQTLACTSSIGPGATNMLTGAALATINRLPVLLLPSDYYATRHQGPVLQQLEHPISADVSVNDAFRPLSRFFDRITRPEQLLSALPEAMRVLTDPAETGAVTLSLPQDVQAHAYDYPAHFFEPRYWRIERRPPDPKRIDEAIQLLKKAKRPAIIAGGGVHYSGAWTQLRKFAETFDIPVAETFAGKGAMRRKSPMLLGGQGVTGNPVAAAITSRADLVFCVGTRMGDFVTGSQGCFNDPDVRFIGINVLGHDAVKQGALAIVADARETLKKLQRKAQDAGIRPKVAYAKQIAVHKAKWDSVLDNKVYRSVGGDELGQGHLIGILNETARAGDTIVSAAGTVPGDMLKLWDATGGRHCHIEFGFSCMSYEIPAAIGVRMAQPSGEVYAMVGDGTYLMNPMELVTSVQEQLKVTVIVSVNHGYQSIHQLQLNSAGRSFGNEFRHRRKKTGRLDGDYFDVDFAANARSFGLSAWHCCGEQEVRDALAEARRSPTSCLIAVQTDPKCYTPPSGVWWDVAPAEAATDPITRRLRKQYERGRSQWQRLHY